MDGLAGWWGRLDGGKGEELTSVGGKAKAFVDGISGVVEVGGCFFLLGCWRFVFGSEYVAGSTLCLFLWEVEDCLFSYNGVKSFAVRLGSINCSLLRKDDGDF